MTSPQNEPDQGSQAEPGDEPRDEAAGEDLAVPQDTFRKVYFGQISDPLFPEPHPPVETREDELTRAALMDPSAGKAEAIDPGPTSWRWVFLLLLAVGALAIIFWKR